MAVIFLGRVVTIPVTDYTNTGGQGDRTASLTISSNITPDGGTINNLIDGGTSANSTDGIDMPGTGSTAIPNGAYVKIDFGSKKYIDEVTVLFDSGIPPNMGNWNWEGSNDDSSYTSFATFAWTSSTKVVTLSNVDPEGFRYWRMIKNGAGSNYTNSYWLELKFKIAAGTT